MDTNSRIQEIANNSEIENSRNKSNVKISEFTVLKTLLHTKYRISVCFFFFFFFLVSDKNISLRVLVQ